MDVGADGTGTGQPGLWARGASGAAEALLAQRGHLLPWAPVALGLGAAAYFALPAEPGPWGWAALGLGGALALLAASILGPATRPLAFAAALVAVGMGLAGWRAHAVAAPVLGFRYYGPVEGRIVGIDRSATDVLRLTLDRVVLEDVPPERTPTQVRVSLHGDQRWLRAEPGRVVGLTGHLAPPNGPAEPGDFDFRRMAWFEGLGAVGYTRSPVVTLAPPEGGLWLHRLRTRLSAAVRDRIGGDTGGLAAAVMTGDRSGLSSEANESMRDSGLYHLVSISGMHMALLVGFVLALVRTCVALVPPLALRVDGKKVAAVLALPVAAFYLALAGRDVATERAFIMVAVMLGAVLLDRQAVTLRSVAVAALIVLALRPEAVANPGFQMSFAAATALTVVFASPRLHGWRGRWRWARPVVVLLVSSLVAGLATAPFAGAHFNRFAQTGLLANLLAVPAMGLLVMPGAALLAMGGAFGLTQPAVAMIAAGCAWILAVSDRIAAMEGAVSGMTSPPGFVLPILGLSALVLILWQGRARWIALLPILAVLWAWAGAERPTLLIAATGGQAGIVTADGRALSHPRGERFAVTAWLENDGDVATFEAAAARPGFGAWEGVPVAQVGDAAVLVARGARALGAVAGCGGADILVTDQPAASPRPCLVLDLPLLRRTGAVAGWVVEGRLRLRTVADAAGDRPWTRAGRDPSPAPDLSLARAGPGGGG